MLQFDEYRVKLNNLKPGLDKLGEALDRQGLPWRLRDAQYEPETGFWHYTWDWEATDG